ncbi:DUF1120 domain-containing protein [Achromobacter sp. Marseille-Q0513]|nr:DUF1120 domain-containing protein [Achromobacter sp. Marseille-Q0513]
MLACALATSLFGALPAHAAAPSASLYVRGSIGVPGCNVSTANDGVYDFGRIASSLIKPGTATTTLDSMEKSWTVSCDAQTFLGFTVIDNRSGTASLDRVNNFGLGNVNETGKIGYYTVQMKDGAVDGKSSYLYATPGTSSTASPSVYLGTNAQLGWAAGSNTQKAGKVFTATLAVTPTLAGSTTMGGPITDEVSLDGSLTLNFAFGL